MTDALDGARGHYRVTGLTGRLTTERAAFGPEDRLLTPERLGGVNQFHTRGFAATAALVANLGRNVTEGRLGILTAVFEAASVNA